MIVFSNLTFSQRNSFSFFYTPAFTKLDIKNFPNKSFLGSWSIYYESQKNDKPAMGYNAGLTFSHRFNKLGIGIGVLYTELSQQSGLYYQWNGFKNYPENYGGTNYIMTYKGVEFPLVFNYLIKHKNRLTLEVELLFSLNTLLEFEVQDYIVKKKNGVSGLGCCTTTMGGGNSDFEILKYRIFHAELEKIRIGTGLGLKFNYDLLKFLSVSIMPTFKYYSNTLKQANNNSSLDADAFLLRTQLSLNLNF